MITVLIVEDDRTTASLLKTLFEMEEFKATICPYPERVIPVVREAQPDLIFMDYHLADAESLPILRQIKEDPGLKAIPVMMASGLDRSEECRKAGADGFLLKPFRPATLITEVRALLEAQKNR